LHDELGLPPVLMRVSDRRLAQGFYLGLDIEDPTDVLRLVDKLDKIGPDAVRDLLIKEAGLSKAQADASLRLAEINSADESFADRVAELGVKHDQLELGLERLTEVVSAAKRYVPGRLVADLKIARGLDYYTGTVYETELVGYPSLGSISSGGRYEALASDGRTTYPGVGLSIGVSRLLVPLLAAGTITASRAVPTAILVAVDAEDTRSTAVEVAERLRRRGIPTEVAPKADKFGKQIRYADRRGIPYVWFGGLEGGEVKDLRSGDQAVADPDTWQPPESDLHPTVGPADPTP